MADETPKRQRGQRGPNKVKRGSMALLSIRLPQHVVDFYGGSSTVMRHVLTGFAEGRIGTKDDT